MLDPLSTWVAQFRALGGSETIHIGDVKLSTLIGTLTNKVQADPGGSVGILSFNIPAMWAYLDSKWEPTEASMNWQAWNNDSWARILSDGWMQGMTLGSISARTDTDSQWDCSGGVDTDTSSVVATTVPNLSALYAALYNDLLPIADQFLEDDGPTNAVATDAVTRMATAFRNAIANAQFICIGRHLYGPDCEQLPLTRNAI